MAKKIIVGNWKMNPDTLRKARDLYSAYGKALATAKKVEVVICAPFVYLHSLRDLKGSPRLSLGAQNVFYEDSGSYTGEISVKMLKNAGVRYGIVGHSERRALGETNEDVNKKMHALLHAGVRSVVCFGESTRDTQGHFYTELEKQLHATLVGLSEKKAHHVILAYEPVWAIGKKSNVAMDGERMREMSIFIRKVLTDFLGESVAQKVRIIYGGSVDATNIEGIIRDGHIDGVLPGRASLDSKEFRTMIGLVNNLI